MDLQLFPICIKIKTIKIIFYTFHNFGPVWILKPHCGVFHPAINMVNDGKLVIFVFLCEKHL